MVSFIVMVAAGLFIGVTYFYMHLRKISFSQTGLAYFFYLALVSLVFSSFMLVLIKDKSISTRWFAIELLKVNQFLDQVAIIGVIIIIALIWIGLMWKLANFVFYKFINKVIRRKWR